MCLHSAYEVGGVVYVRALGAPETRGAASNTYSKTDGDELSLRPNRTTALDGRHEEPYTAPTRRSQSPSPRSASPQR